MTSENTPVRATFAEDGAADNPDSASPAVSMAAPFEHNDLSLESRALPDQHPQAAITGLVDSLAAKANTSDVTAALAAKAPLASPALTGTPTAPTAPTGTNTTQIATTAFVMNQGYAPLISPALTGTPTAPTAPTGTDSTQIATTAFVKNQGYAPLVSPALIGTPTAPTAPSGTDSTQVATTAFVKNQGYASLASPTFTGTPTAPTASSGTDSTQIATTAFVKAQGYAPLASPALTGTPTAPTPPAETDSTQLATTAFVRALLEQYTPVSIPIGGLLWHTSIVAPNNFIAPSGDLVSRALYPALWAHAQASGMLVTDAEWLATDGPIGCYSSGDGATTFRLPMLGGQFLRAWVAGQTTDAGRVAGGSQGDAIRNFAGTLRLAGTLGIRNSAAPTGPFHIGSTLTQWFTPASVAEGVSRSIGFDPSRVVPTATENRPVNIAWPCFIRCK